MKFTKQSDNEYFGRFEENEDLKQALLELCKTENIQSGWFTIIGAVKNSEIAFYDQDQGKYLNMALDEHAEIINCTGNVSLNEGEPFVHMHATLADREGRAYGGHVTRAKVFAAEFYIKKFDKPVERRKDESIGLGLLEP
ncbi:MAG: PPC domain-containing DNA-binding protein [archaeon]